MVKQTHQKEFPLFILLIIVIIFIFILFIAYQQTSISKQVPLQQIPVTTRSLPTIATTNWISFASTQDTFSLKTPPTFTRNPQSTGDIILLEQQLNPNTHQPITPLSSIAASYMLDQGNSYEACATDEDGYQQILPVAQGAYTASRGTNTYHIITETVLGKPVKGIVMLTPERINKTEGTNLPAQVNEYINICHNRKLFGFEFVIDGNLDVAAQQQFIINSILSSFTFFH